MTLNLFLEMICSKRVAFVFYDISLAVTRIVPEGDSFHESCAVPSSDSCDESYLFPQVTLVIENGGMPLFTIHDATTPYWEVTTVPATTSKRGKLNPGDLVLRINDTPVSGLDTRKALDSSHAKVSLLPAASKLAQRIKEEGLMSFTTQVILCSCSLHRFPFFSVPPLLSLSPTGNPSLCPLPPRLLSHPLPACGHEAILQEGSSHLETWNTLKMSQVLTLS